MIIIHVHSVGTTAGGKGREAQSVHVAMATQSHLYKTSQSSPELQWQEEEEQGKRVGYTTQGGPAGQASTRHMCELLPSIAIVR